MCAWVMGGITLAILSIYIIIGGLVDEGVPWSSLIFMWLVFGGAIYFVGWYMEKEPGMNKKQMEQMHRNAVEMKNIDHRISTESTILNTKLRREEEAEKDARRAADARIQRGFELDKLKMESLVQLYMQAADLKTQVTIHRISQTQQTRRTAITAATNLLSSLANVDKDKPGLLEQFTNEITGITGTLKVLNETARSGDISDEEEEQLHAIGEALDAFLDQRVLKLGKS